MDHAILFVEEVKGCECEPLYQRQLEAFPITCQQEVRISQESSVRCLGKDNQRLHGFCILGDGFVSPSDCAWATPVILVFRSSALEVSC